MRMRLGSAVIAALLLASSAFAYTVSGRVVDTGGAPVSDAMVWLDQQHAVQKTNANGSGAFSFANIGAGLVQIVARKQGLALGGMNAIVVGNADVTLTLAKPVERVIRVIGPDAQPLAGARVKSFTVGPLQGAGEFSVPALDLIDSGFPSLRSGDDGAVRLSELPEKSFVRLTLAHHKYAEQFVPYLNAEGAEQTFRLYPGITIHGRVTDAQNKGIPRAQVAVFTTTTGGQRQAANTLSDPEGYYTLTVPAGTYQVAAMHPAYAPSMPREAAPAANADDSIVDFTLQQALFLEGNVLGPNDAPMGGVRLIYLLNDIAVNETLSQQDGKFRIAVAVGEGRLRTLPPDGFLTQDASDILLKNQEGGTATLSPIRLKALPEVSGVVLCPDGTPAASALIASRDLEPPMWAVTDANGAFTVRLDRAPLSHTATFRAEHNRRLLRKDFTVNLDTPARVEVTIEQFEPDMRANDPASTDNQVTRLDGKPAPELACDTWFNGQAVALKDLKGKVVVLTFWGGFAASGRALAQLQELRAMHDAMRTVDDVVFVGIHDGNVDAKDAEAYTRQLGIEFLVGVDAKPFQTFERYMIKYLPQTFLIDKEGVVRYYDTAGRLCELIKALRR